MSKASQKKLKEDVKKYLHLPTVKKLFPRSPPDFRTDLTEYQAKKLSKMVRTAKGIGGLYHKNITHIGKGRKNFLEAEGWPTYLRGYFPPGGEKINKNAVYVKGALYYERGGSARELVKIDTANGEEGVIKSINKILPLAKGRKFSATAAGRKIGQILPQKNKQIFIKECLYVFNKYEQAWQAQEMGVDENTENVPEGFTIIGNTVYRDKTAQGKGLIKVARPNDWGMAVLFEGAKNDSKKGNKK